MLQIIQAPSQCNKEEKEREKKTHIHISMYVCIYIHMYIYYTPRYFHNNIFRYMTLERYYAVISLYTAQAHYPSSYSNQPNFSIFSGGFTATFLWCTLLPAQQVRAAAKISARGVGSPYFRL